MDAPRSMCDRILRLQGEISPRVGAEGILCVVPTDVASRSGVDDLDQGRNRREDTTCTCPGWSHVPTALASVPSPSRSRSPPFSPGLRLSRSRSALSGATGDMSLCSLHVLQDTVPSKTVVAPDGELRALNRRVRVQLRDLLLAETEKMHPDEQTALLQAVINRFAQAENDEALQDVMDSMRLHGRWA